MLDPDWVFAGAALGMVGSTRYAIATLRGTARPNLVTWTLWAAAPLIGFLAQLDAGVGLPAVQTLAAGAGPLLVVVAALLTRYERTRLGAFDLACALISALALVVWLGFDAAPLAVLLAVAADAAAALPTVRKAWREPHTENLLFYVLIGLGSTITLLTLRSWAPHDAAFPVYILTVCLVIGGIVTLRRRATAPTR